MALKRIHKVRERRNCVLTVLAFHASLPNYSPSRLTRKCRFEVQVWSSARLDGGYSFQSRYLCVRNVLQPADAQLASQPAIIKSLAVSIFDLTSLLGLTSVRADRSRSLFLRSVLRDSHLTKPARAHVTISLVARVRARLS